MEINSYAVISRAIRKGVQVGITQAYEHTDLPSREIIEDTIHDEVMLALEEIITWQPEVMLNESKEYKESKDVSDVQTNYSQYNSLGNQESRGKLQETGRLIGGAFILGFLGVPLMHFVYWYWFYLFIGR